MPGQLSHSPANVVQRLLVALGQCVRPSVGGNWPAYVGDEPDAPDNCVTVYDTTPVLQGRTMTDGEVQERHGVQVRVRSAGLTVGFAKTSAIIKALTQDAYQNELTLDSTTYRVHALSLVTGPIHIGKDKPEGRRDVHTANLTVSVRELS